MQDEQQNVVSLLTEIRDAQREHLAAYREQAHRAIALQEVAIAKQRQVSRVYYVALSVISVLVAYGLYEFIF